MAIPERVRSTAPSAVHKQIKIRAQQPENAAAIKSEMKLNDVTARILAARGYKVDQTLKHFLNPTLKEGLPDPSCLKGLKEACSLIKQVHDSGKAIAICCDFDVDGLSGGSLVHDFLNSIGVKSQVFVPDRFVDGYGLNENAVKQIAASGNFGCLLTIDFGTTNVKELTLAHELGLKTIVVDHHHLAADPPAVDVFINPHRKDCNFAGKILCAAGLAWYLVIGLKNEFAITSFDSRVYLEIACLGTICDMVPLIGANRVIAKRGLELLSESKRYGLRSLKNVIGIRGAVGCSDVSFGIGPRLNAAGRLVHGNQVVELLTTKDSVKADKIARDLHELNLERQEVENTVKQAAIKIIESRGELEHGLVVWDAEFHTGVIGIVAQRLVETFYRPSAVMGVDSPGIFKGSVRGIKGLSVVETLAACSEHLIKFGGHDGAGGFSVKESDLEKFRKAFVSECKKRLKKIEAVPYAEADTVATLPEITLDLINELKNLAPFGVGNPAPQLLIEDLRVVDVRELKGAHLKVVFSDGKRFISGLMWRQSSHPALFVDSKVRMVCRPETNTYMGALEIIANIQAVEPIN